MLSAACACVISCYREGGYITLENMRRLSSMLNCHAKFCCVEGHFKCILAGLLTTPCSKNVHMIFTELHYLKFKEEV